MTFQLLFFWATLMVNHLSLLVHYSNVFRSFIHLGYFYSTSSSPLLLRGAPEYSTDTVSEFHAEVFQATASEGLGQAPYVAARVGFEKLTG